MPMINIYTNCEGDNEKQACTSANVNVVCGSEEIDMIESIEFGKILPGDLVSVTIKCFVRLGK